MLKKSFLAFFNKLLIGFESEDEWFDFRLENDPRFLRRIESARASLRAGRRIKPEDLKT